MKKSKETAKQKRSETTIGYILQAALIGLGEIGSKKLSTNRIAKIAGVSIGTLYHHFKNKEDIFISLSKAVADQNNKFYIELTKDLTVENRNDQLQTIVYKICDEVLSNRKQIRILFRAIPKLGEMQIVLTAHREVLNHTRTILEEIYEVGSDKKARALSFSLVNLYIGCIFTHIIDEEIYLDDNELKNELFQSTESLITSAQKIN